jgi:hypothetical protein
MLTFKSFLAERLFHLEEARSVLIPISRSDKAKFDKAISPHTYDVKSSTPKTTTIIIRALNKDRPKVKEFIERSLDSANLQYSKSREGGSIGSTDVNFGDHNIKITYKPVSGGMSETTLNSTITELAPALAFMAKRKFTTIEKFYEFLSDTKGNEYRVYVNNKDAEAGNEFIKAMPSSSKFKEKMENAMAILDYLYEEHSKSPIHQVYWGYRAKPSNIASSHKGDIFIEYKTGNWLGVSLKAGGDKTAEPQLNTYVNKLYDDFGRTSAKNKLIDKVYSEIHSKLGLPKNWQDRSQKNDSIEKIIEFKNSNKTAYDEMYDEMLKIIRSDVVYEVGLNVKDTIDYIRKQVIKKDENVPLVVVKAFGKKFKYVSDEDDLEIFLQKVKTIKTYESKSSKQNWFIELNSGGEKLVMNMSIRSNQPMPKNKIAQGFNLAIKFNGIN